MTMKKARKELRKRFAKQYAEQRKSEKIGAASDVRSLNGDELMRRKAELEARGLPPTKAKTIRSSYRGKKETVSNARQIFSALTGLRVK